MKEKQTLGELALAAAGLEEALSAFERATAVAAKTPLTSQRNIEKAAQAVTTAARCQPEIGSGVQRMLAALNGARDRNTHTAEALQAFGERLRAKSESYGALLTRFGELGDRARDTSEAARALSVPEMAVLSHAEKIERLSGVEAAMTALIDDAGKLVQQARAEDVDDISQQADSLRQQLQAARNKVSLLFRKLGSGTA
jgi:ABC-type transporter Mla subunit MlaD